MKVIKNINNNVSLCLDSQNREVIVFGKGIGFTKPPYDVPLEKIERTFYSVHDSYINVIQGIPNNILNIAIKIVEYASLKLETAIPSVVTISLADHIHFAIERLQTNIHIDIPLQEHIKQLYKKEMKIGKVALLMIQKDLDLILPDIEAIYIAMHFINICDHNTSEIAEKKSTILNDCTQIIENCLQIKIDRNSFNYSRFITHLDYLLNRVNENKMIETSNAEMFLSLKEHYRKSYACSLMICKYVKKQMKLELNQEELIYLMIHINRLSSREGCYR